jgi:hypothetical protein
VLLIFSFDWNGSKPFARFASDFFSNFKLAGFAIGTIFIFGLEIYNLTNKQFNLQPRPGVSAPAFRGFDGEVGLGNALEDF